MLWRHQKFTLHHEGRYLIATSIHCKIDSFLELDPLKSILSYDSKLCILLPTELAIPIKAPNYARNLKNTQFQQITSAKDLAIKYLEYLA